MNVLHVFVSISVCISLFVCVGSVGAHNSRTLCESALQDDAGSYAKITLLMEEVDRCMVVLRSQSRFSASSMRNSKCFTRSRSAGTKVNASLPAIFTF